MHRTPWGGSTTTQYFLQHPSLANYRRDCCGDSLLHLLLHSPGGQEERSSTFASHETSEQPQKSVAIMCQAMNISTRRTSCRQRWQRNHPPQHPRCGIAQSSKAGHWVPQHEELYSPEFHATCNFSFAAAQGFLPKSFRHLPASQSDVERTFRSSGSSNRELHISKCIRAPWRG